ncbi:hypothetical protein HDE_01323 [Halotydeus destructor]|nr:hypothetical protein HDE_01323 [Halotydeus destructor]
MGNAKFCHMVLVFEKEKMLSNMLAMAMAMACLGGAMSLAMTSSTFAGIEKICYRRDNQGRPYPLGQAETGPLGQSMENFISLIEKIEQFNERIPYRPETLAAMLLSRFNIDENNYDPNYNVFKQEADVQYRNRIRANLLDVQNLVHPSDFPELSLTDDEKCSMYFMLSHNVNRTAQKGDKKVYSPSQYPTGSRNQPSQRYRNVQFTENPREQGVVSFRNNEEHAIAPARVLLGILGAFSAVQSMRVGELLKLTSKPLETDAIKRQDDEVNTLLAVTLGDIWAFGAAPSDLGRTDSKFGAFGKWNSTVCQTEYVLESKNSRGSLAEIRGAIDGLLLGKKAKEVMSSGGGKFRLSSLMRMYYSPSGLFDDYTSVCHREGITGLVGQLKDQVKSYMYAFIPISLGQAMEENRINEYVDVTSGDWENALRRAWADVSADKDWCEKDRLSSPGYGGRSNNEQCETPSDVIVMVDLVEEINQQMDLVARISNGLDMRNHGSSMTIVASTRGGGLDYNADGLSRIAWNTQNRGCATCRLAWADKANFGTSLGNSPDQLLTNINTTLRDLKVEKANESGVPGKPFLFFNYGFAKKPTGDTKKFYQARYELKRNHRDVPLIVVGKGNAEDLQEFTYDSNNVIESDSPVSQELANQILDKICETPAAIQYAKCAEKPSKGEVHVGYVTPGKKQYWAMFPEYYLKTFTASFEFTATNGPYKVCYRRGTPKPEEEDKNCKLVKPGDDAAIFRVKNPCHKFGLHDCYPLYFTIIGQKEGTPSVANKCKEEGCLNMDQIKWQVSHDGISCNSALKLASFAFMPLTIFTAILLSIFNSKSF